MEIAQGGSASYNHLKDWRSTTAASVDRLREVSFFADMSEHDLSQIAGITEEKRYQGGEVIIEERTSAERFFIILHGKIEITKRFEDGEQLVLAVHSDGEFFGEMALLDEGLRSATARAVEATSLLEISRQEFETLLYKAPVLAYRILKELSSRLRETGALLVSHLRRRNRQLYRAYLDTVSAFLEGVEARDPLRRGRTTRLRALSRALAGELGVADEEMLVLEIAVVLRELDLSSYPANLPARPGPQLKRILDVAVAFEALRHPAAGRAAAGEDALQAAQALAESGSDLDPKTIEALQRLAETGRLP